MQSKTEAEAERAKISPIEAYLHALENAWRSPEGLREFEERRNKPRRTGLEGFFSF